MKNDDETLPSSTNVSVAVVGETAHAVPRFQGAGSSRVVARSVTTLLDGVREHVDRVEYAAGHASDDDDDATSSRLLDEALAAAARADVVVLALGLDETVESEAFDRDDTGLPPRQTALWEALVRAHDRVVLVLFNGGALTLPDDDLVDGTKAMLEAHLPGQAGGGAVADLLFGAATPSGKLAETMWRRREDVPSDPYFPGDGFNVEYREGLRVGYRRGDDGVAPRFAFGHGLSYASFRHEDLVATVVRDDGDDDVEVRVSFAVVNVGDRHVGAEVAQIYVGRLSSSPIHRPPSELRAFAKTRPLAPGGDREAREATLTSRAFAYYDVGRRAWTVEPGAYEIRLAAASDDVRATTTVALRGGGRPPSDEAVATWPASSGPASDGDVVDDATFARRFVGGVVPRLPRDDDDDDAPLHRNSALAEARDRGSWLGRAAYRLATWAAASELRSDRLPPSARRRLVREAVDGLPLRAIVLFAGGAVPFWALDAFVGAMNRCARLGRWWRRRRRRTRADDR